MNLPGRSLAAAESACKQRCQPFRLRNFGTRPSRHIVTRRVIDRPSSVLATFELVYKTLTADGLKHEHSVVPREPRNFLVPKPELSFTDKKPLVKTRIIIRYQPPIRTSGHRRVAAVLLPFRVLIPIHIFRKRIYQPKFNSFDLNPLSQRSDILKSVRKVEASLPDVST